MKHSVIRTDLLDGASVGASLCSVKYYVDDVETAIDNGNVVYIPSLDDGERSVRHGVAPTASTSLKDVVIIATPEVFYDERMRNLEDFYNVAGAVCRGYRLRTLDEIAVTYEAFATELDIINVGDLVELSDGVQLHVVESATGATLIGKIDHVEYACGKKYYTIKLADDSESGGGGGGASDVVGTAIVGTSTAG